MSSTQIILCARLPAIANSIADGLLPEFRAVHVFNTPEQGLAAIPALLSAEEPHISQFAAVVVGGGFSDAHYDAMRVACGGRRSVPWFKADRSHFASMPPLDKPEAFGAQAAARIKARLVELRIGQSDGAAAGEYLF